MKPHVIQAILAIMIAVATLVSCGRQTDGEYSTTPQPVPDFQSQVVPVIKANCGGCHYPGSGLPALGTPEAFKASKAKSELLSGAMPKGKVIIDGDKAVLLAYLR